MNVKILKWLENRHVNSKWVDELRKHRLNSLELSCNRLVNRRDGSGSAQWLDIESCEQRYLLSGSHDGSVDIFDLNCRTIDGRQHCEPVGTVPSTSKDTHRHGVSCVSWYPVDSGLFLSSGDDSVKVWDTNKLTMVVQFPFEDSVKQHDMSSAPGDQKLMVAVATNSSLIHLVDLRSGWQLQNLRGHKGKLRFVQFSPIDPVLLASGSSDGQILLWDIRSTKTYLKSLSSAFPALRNSCLTPAHSGAVVSLKFTPDGNCLISYGADGRMVTWDAVKGRLRDIMDLSAIAFVSRKNLQIDVAYDAYGSELICVPVNNSIRLVSFQTGKIQRILNGHFHSVTGCVYRPLYQELYSCGYDQRIHCWTPQMDQCWGKSQDADQVKSSLNQDNWGDL